MRAGVGTTKGELLAMAASTVEWEGLTFPAVEFEGEMLPEAFPSQPGTLPHLHADERSRYPRAAVHHSPGDEDPWCEPSLEERGIALERGLGAARPKRALMGTIHGSLKSMDRAAPRQSEETR